MAKNNYFNYVDFHNQNYFLIYLLSFAMDEYKDDDPLLSECAKELIRYILGMDKTENVIVTEYDGEDTFIVNHNKCILIDQFPPYTIADIFVEYNNVDYNVDYYCVIYVPSLGFLGEPKGFPIVYLSIKKLKEIYSKYPIKNEIYQHYMHWLEEQERLIQKTLQTPIEHWKLRNEGHLFVTHLLEDSIVDVSKGIGMADLWSSGLCWYFVSKNELRTMGVHDYICRIYLLIARAKIEICFHCYNDGDDKAKKCVKEMESFVNNICPMPMTFDLSDYKEKIQYAQRIMDRLKTEFKLSLDDETNSEE